MYLTECQCLAILAFVGTVAAQTDFMLDCTNCPEACNNDCYGVFELGLDEVLNYVGPDDDRSDPRRGSGCTQSSGKSVCGNDGVDPWKGQGEQCDEYPYASVEEGDVAGSSLRCIAAADNQDEGTQLSTFYGAEDGLNGEAGEFNVYMVDDTYNYSPFCINQGGDNDGHQFILNDDGSYGAAKKKHSFKPREVYSFSKPRNSFPVENRRVFMLEDGTRVLALSRNETKSHAGRSVFHHQFGKRTIVSELLGEQKGLPKW